MQVGLKKETWAKCQLYCVIKEEEHYAQTPFGCIDPTKCLIIPTLPSGPYTELLTIIFGSYFYHLCVFYHYSSVALLM